MIIGIRAKSYEIMQNEGYEVCRIILENNHIPIFLDKNFKCENVDAEVFDEINFYKKSDAIIILGGDGTLLKTAVLASEYDVPILGINHGRVGLLTDMEKTEISEIAKLFNKEYTIDKRMLIKAKIITNGKTEKEVIALNDIVISRGNSPKMLELSLYIDGELTTNIRADGIVVATPTGSTAYSLSAGGSVIDPKAELMAFTPICPHTLKSRPLIISADRSVVLRNSGKNAVSSVSCDGQNVMTMDKNSEVQISISEKKLKLIRIKNRNFYSVLKDKL